MSLKRTALKPDGTIDSAGLARWTKANQDALRALPPETQARFADAATAGDAIAEAQAARNAAVKAAQQGVTGKLLGLTEPGDMTKTVATALNGRTSVADMGRLADAVAGNPEATTGLRQAVVDHITSRLFGNTEAGTTGVGQIKADQFQTFMRTNRAALAKVFTPDEIGNLEAVAADIQRSKRSDNALKLAGSNTAQDAHAAGIMGIRGRSILDVLGASLGATIGASMHGGEGAGIGSALGGVMTEAVQAVRARGVARVDDLVREAMLNPDVARRLLAKVPTDGAGNIAPKVFKARMAGLVAALGAVTDTGDQAPSRKPVNAMAPTPQRPVVLPAAPNAMGR